MTARNIKRPMYNDLAQFIMAAILEAHAARRDLRAQFGITITEISIVAENDTVSARLSDGSRLTIDAGHMVPRGYFDGCFDHQTPESPCPSP